MTIFPLVVSRATRELAALAAPAPTTARARKATAMLRFMMSVPPYSKSPGMLPRPVGVILAGGASTRMGRDKALLEIEGETLLARAARRLGEVCEEVLVADAGRFGGIPDGPGRGPAAGLLGAARARPGRALLVLAVDLPF